MIPPPPTSTLFPYTTLFRSVLLLEKWKKPGVKILMSGGTRCNITHDCDPRGIVAAFGPNGKFLHSAQTRTRDRKSTRLNSSHSQISYAVFCLKKKKIKTSET